MIIDARNHDEFHLFAVTAEPEDYDGHPPIGQLLVECWPTRLTPEIWAVASVLAFRPYISTFSPSRAISPTCARAVAGYLGDDRMTIQPVTLEPSPFLEAGHKELVVVAPELGCPEPAGVSDSQLVMRLMDRTTSFGFFGEFSTVSVATNAHALARHVHSERDRRALALACGVLLAPSMGCGGVALVGPQDGDIRELVNATGLSLQFLDR